MKGDEGYNQNFGVRIASFLAGGEWKGKEEDDGRLKVLLKQG